MICSSTNTNKAAIAHINLENISDYIVLNNFEDHEIGDIPSAIIHGESQKLYRISENLIMDKIDDEYFQAQRKRTNLNNLNQNLKNKNLNTINKNFNDNENFNNLIQNKDFDEIKVFEVLNSDEENLKKSKNSKIYQDIIFRCKCCKAILAKDDKGNLLYPHLVNIFPYNTNIRDFASSGGVGLFFYFYFLKICIAILLITFILSSIPFFFFSYSARQDLISFCSSREIQVKYNQTCLNQIYYTDVIYFNTFLKPWNVSNLVIFFSQFSCVTIEDYMQLEYQINKNASFIIFDETIISLITQITIFIINLLIFIVSYNTIHEIDFLNISASDYTLMISNLDQNFKNILEILQYLEIVD